VRRSTSPAGDHSELDVTSAASLSGEAGRGAGATWAILVAAGTGDRLGGDRPKAFVGLAGRPLLAESLERLDASDWIDAIVVVAPPGWEEPAILLAEELVASKVSAVVTGGTTRAQSVRNGLADVPQDALVVVVHDAARPLVDDVVIERLLGRLAEGVDGVIPGVAVRDTVKRVERGAVVETLDREALVAVQTPQAFLADRLRDAYGGDLTGATDCASLVERAGGRVAVVEGDPRLAKVTTSDDLELVSRLLAADTS
jgi:2-C-methyl-D-erythritol 4-phosphate cytidylyltransferase